MEDEQSGAPLLQLCSPVAGSWTIKPLGQTQDHRVDKSEPQWRSPCLWGYEPPEQLWDRQHHYTCELMTGDSALVWFCTCHCKYNYMCPLLRVSVWTRRHPWCHNCEKTISKTWEQRRKNGLREYRKCGKQQVENALNKFSGIDLIILTT